MKDIERMVISAYEDGEVESPWKEQVEKRLAADAEWALEAHKHHDVKARLAASPEPDWSQASQRVWARLESHSTPKVRALPLAWISVAAALLLVAGGYWMGRQTAPNSAPAAVAELKVQVPKTLELKLSGEGQLLMASTLQGNRR